MSKRREWARAALADMNAKGKARIVADLRGPLGVGDLMIRSGDVLELTPFVDSHEAIGSPAVIGWKGRVVIGEVYGRKGTIHGVYLRGRMIGIHSVKLLAAVRVVTEHE